MKASQIIYESLCQICGSKKTYKNFSNYKKCKDKPCKSCSNSISGGGSGNVKPVDGYKVCNECKESKSISEFHYYKDKNYYHSFCNKCKGEKFRSYQKNKGRFYRYGITKDEYENMYQEQEGKCFLCEKHQEVLCIDHNHTTGKIRKLLCKDCNSALGLLKENLSTIKKIINYINNYG